MTLTKEMLESMETYNELIDSEVVKKFLKAQHVINEVWSRTVEYEVYKKVGKYSLLIELPYDTFWFSGNKLITKHYGYDGKILSDDNKRSVHFCASLCKYSKESVMKLLDDRIVEMLEEEKESK